LGCFPTRRSSDLEVGQVVCGRAYLEDSVHDADRTKAKRIGIGGRVVSRIRIQVEPARGPDRAFLRGASGPGIMPPACGSRTGRWVQALAPQLVAEAGGVRAPKLPGATDRGALVRPRSCSEP